MDDDLQQIREKKLQEMRSRLENPGGHGGIIPITQENIQAVIGAHQNLVIDFWAPWCGPCRMLGPVIEELAAAYDGQVSFGKCNTDENQSLAYQYGISAIPALLFYHHGQVVHQLAGALPRPQLEAQIRMVFQLS